MRGTSFHMLPAVTAATLLAHMAAMASAMLAAGPAAAAATISVVSSSQQGRIVLPGGNAIEIFKLKLQNIGALPETLIAVTFQNRTTGPGTQAQLDGEWTPLVLTAAGGGIVANGSPGGPATASFSGGSAGFTNLQIPIAPLDTVTVHVSGAASLAARKNDVLDLRIPANQGLTFSPSASVNPNGVIDPSGSFLVLGMAAAQVVVHDVATKQFAIGTQRNLALDLTLPANGYQTDLLQKLNVVNKGDAEGGVDLPGMEAWVDDGDGRFDPAHDTRLAPLEFTGNRWEATGLSWPVPLAGLRVFVSVDIAEQANVARTVRLGLPVPPDIAVQMQSGNDGPVDQEVMNSTTAPITAVDRVILTTGVPVPGVAHPGDPALPLLELVASNTYAVPQQMEALVFTNATLGPGSLSQRDGELQMLTLREDGDDNGKLGDTAQDPVLGTAFFIGGRAAFSGFAWGLPAGATRRLFLTADVSLTGATDGNVLGAVVSGAADVDFTVPITVSAGWPLGNATWTVDGMVAGQITNLGALGVSLGANDGPALALDLIVPRNGYTDDLLESFSVVNVGTATPADFSELRLWRDGGNGIFDAGAGDDRDLGALANGGGVWASGSLNEALGASGARLFVSVLTSASPTDSATVKLAVPVDGIAVASGNDGPLDTAPANPTALLLSTAPLLASLAISPTASTVGQSVTVRMTVRNVGSETVNAVTPSPLRAGGSGTLTPVSGPAPASAVIAAGAQQVFTWTFSAGSPGDATLAGSASGTGAGSGLPRQSLTAGSNLHRIFDQADRLGLSAFDAMPLSVNRSQTDVVPLYLTFSSLGGASGSDVRLRRLSVRLESGSGAGVIPSGLLGRVAVHQGDVTYLDRTSLETSGSDVDLTLATPILVSATRPVTVALSLDILAGTVVPNFRVVIPDSTRFIAEDATSGAPVSLTLGSGSFPVRSGLARVVAEATELDINPIPAPSAQVGRGQSDAALLTARLTNPGVVGVGSDVRVSAFTVGLVDTNGMRVPNPGVYLARLRVRNGPQIVADRSVAAQEESLFAVTLSPLVSVPVGSPIDLRISADIAGDAALGAFCLRLADSTLFDARDANTGRAVPVRYAVPVLEGPAITVEARAESVLARGVPRLPATVGAGSSGVYALDALLRHPGGPGTARLRLDSLTVRCVDESRNPLVPATFVAAMRVLWNGTPVAALTGPPAQGNTMGVALSGLLIAPGDSATVTLVLDFQATAPPSSFELMLNASGITASDANTGLAALPVAMPGAELPLVSGLTRLASPARTLSAGLTDLMPPGFAPDGRPITVARVTVLNPAPAGSGTIAVDHLTLRAADQALRAVPMAAGALQLSLDQGATPWAQAAAGGADSLMLTGAAPLVLAPGQPLTLDVRLTPSPTPTVSSFRLGFGASDVGVVQPGNPLLHITVQPLAGSFPLWTQAGGISPTRLAASYSNFPNPFAAGREATTFSYYLPGPGRVTLQVWTARGERVTSLQVDAARPAGLQQSDTWDGRNGRGVAVVNGVYLAELSVAFDDGTRQRVLRRVAVVR